MSDGKQKGQNSRTAKLRYCLRDSKSGKMCPRRERAEERYHGAIKARNGAGLANMALGRFAFIRRLPAGLLLHNWSRLSFQ